MPKSFVRFEGHSISNGQRQEADGISFAICKSHAKAGKAHRLNPRIERGKMTSYELGTHEHRGFLRTKELFWSARYRQDGIGMVWDALHNLPITPTMGIFPHALAYCQGWEVVSKEFRLKAKAWFPSPNQVTQ